MLAHIFYVRRLFFALAALLVVFDSALLAAVPGREIAAGPFTPAWDSLAHYECPEWFRDAKFGIWARWDAQSVPEQGEDYARSLYLPTLPNKRPNPTYSWHIDHFGHPSLFGFKDLFPLWKADQWEPEKILALFQRAGARYFVALANDTDNFDCYDSKYQPWNSVAVGPHQDIVAVWAAAARAAGLRFGVSVHAAAAWSWFEPAQGHDATGPYAGLAYDGRLTDSDGHGNWWNGLDPSADLYAQFHRPGAKPDAAYITKFFLRTKDLIDHYHPELLYFGDANLPLGEAGLGLAAHFYNTSLAAHDGRMDVVLAAPVSDPARRTALVATTERAASATPQPEPWQTVTSIGQWHYKAGLKYRPVADLVRQLVDVVSKNGNLLLDVPLRASGIPDPDEVRLLDALTAWMTVHGEGIYATRPWKIFGEGPSLVQPAPDGLLAEAKLAFTAQDIRFTQTKDGRTLYAFLLGWPKDGKLTIHSLAKTNGQPDELGQHLASLTLLGSPEKIAWTRDASGLHVLLPATAPNDSACALKLVLE
jgi:alpha-L-fucosidase